MDRSVRLPDPVAAPPRAERRRRVRQKLHTPVYASFNSPQGGQVVDLSELLDLSEDGFAVQTGAKLEQNRAVALCLELPETQSYVHGYGQVVWSDDTGRVGIRFSALPENSRKKLQEWLFANLLIACSNYSARSQQLARRGQEPIPRPLPMPGNAGVFPISVGGQALSELETVRRVAQEIGGDGEAALVFIAERSLSLTRASGAALAYLNDGNMICRASAGELAPPLGAHLDMKEGLSGVCFRSGILVSCEDAQNDWRVDPDVPRALGIGSMMAVPIVSDFRVVGLLEVFAPRPRSFTKAHGAILESLVEMIPQVPWERASAPDLMESGSRHSSSMPARETSWEPEAPTEIMEPEPEPPPATAPRVSSRVLLGLSIAVVFVVLGYLLGPLIQKRWASPAQVEQQAESTPTSKATSKPTVPSRGAATKSPAELQKLADLGDAEAQYQMGVLSHNGEGVPHDDARAMRWFLRAAEQGHVAAQSHLGAYYWAGRGVPEDLSQAYFWSTIALAGGDENSKSRLEGLASQMTRAQVLAARQQAEIWIHQHTAAKPAKN
jgi:GAF domain/Sel1 repeat/PilZ domain